MKDFGHNAVVSFNVLELKFSVLNSVGMIYFDVDYD